jgi:hypothetical protein
MCLNDFFGAGGYWDFGVRCLQDFFLTVLEIILRMVKDGKGWFGLRPLA